MRMRAKGETQACPLSTMADLYRIVAESDRVITLKTNDGPQDGTPMGIEGTLLSSDNMALLGLLR